MHKLGPRCRDRLVRIRLTEATDTMYSFYLQRNIYNIYTTENSLEHVVPVASLHRRVRLRVCSTVCVCLPGRQRAAFVWKPATYVTSCTLSVSTCGLSHITWLSITVDHQHIRPRVHCSRPPRRVVQRLDRDTRKSCKFEKCEKCWFRGCALSCSAVCCNQSCLCVCGFVFVGGSVTMITRNCVHRSSANWVCR